MIRELSGINSLAVCFE